MKKRLFLLMGILTCFLSLTTKTLASKNNVSEETTLIIHKLLLNDQFKEDDELINNDGSLHPDGLELLKNQTGLNGVTFSLYDVTTQFYELRQKGYSVEECQQLLSQMEMSQQAIATGVTQTVGEEAGILQFIVPRQQQNQYAVYLIKETNKPDNIKESSTPIVVVLPIYDENHQELDEIHLYIKNESLYPDLPSLDKQVDQNQLDYNYGDTIPYSIETQIPQDILQYTSYQLRDEAEDALWLVREKIDKETIKVQIDGVSHEEIYEVTELRNHGYTLDFKPEKMSEFVGKPMTISYQMLLKPSLSYQPSFMNQAILMGDNKWELKADQMIFTGGYHFKKVDMVNPQKTLGQAKFIVKNNQNDYLQEAGNWTKDREKARVFISDKEGIIDLYGLRYGSYYLIEIEAPKGYLLSQTPVEFKVTKTSETETKSIPHKIVNKKESEQSVNTGSLPKTNDTINQKMMMIGYFLVSISLFIKMKGATKNEE